MATCHDLWPVTFFTLGSLVQWTSYQKRFELSGIGINDRILADKIVSCSQSCFITNEFLTHNRQGHPKRKSYNSKILEITSFSISQIDSEELFEGMLLQANTGCSVRSF